MDAVQMMRFMRRILGIVVLVFCVGVAAGQVGQKAFAQEIVTLEGFVQDDTFPAEIVHALEIDKLGLLSEIVWSPNEEYFALRMSLWRIYHVRTGELVAEKPFLSWYEDSSRFLFEDNDGISAFNMQTGEVDFTLPHNANDIAWRADQFEPWMKYLDAIPQAWLGDELILFNWRALFNPITDVPSFFVYDSQTGEEVFSLANVSNLPMYFPSREQVIITRNSPTRIEIYDRTTWEVTNTLEGFVQVTMQRAWSGDGAHLMVVASDVPLAPISYFDDGDWDYQIWTPQESTLIPVPDTNRTPILVGQSQLATTSDNNLVLYSALTGEITRVVEIDLPFNIYIYGHNYNDEYIMISIDTPSSRQEYAVWDIVAEELSLLGNQEFGYTWLEGYTVWVYDYADYFKVYNLATGAAYMVETGAPFMTFSGDERWAATLDSEVEYGPMTLTLYNLETGRQFSREVEPMINIVYWRDDGAVFVLNDYRNNVLSVWAIR